ncbi:MAG: hypothetical protein ACYDCX_12130 [Acidithiobacillus sp.]
MMVTDRRLFVSAAFGATLFPLHPVKNLRCARAANGKGVIFMARLFRLERLTGYAGIGFHAESSRRSD